MPSEVRHLIITGPNGSGKTLTLNSLAAALDTDLSGGATTTELRDQQRNIEH